jgi:hypothetical protein
MENNKTLHAGVDFAKSNSCSDCKSFIQYDKSIVLYSCPPKYKGVCVNCNKIYYKFCSKVD